MPAREPGERGRQRVYCKGKGCRQQALYAMRRAPGLSAHGAGGVHR